MLGQQLNCCPNIEARVNTTIFKRTGAFGISTLQVSGLSKVCRLLQWGNMDKLEKICIWSFHNGTNRE
jgi:hypothetical protein